MSLDLSSTIAELKFKIGTAIACVSKDTFQNVVKRTEFRMRLNLHQDGGHFKNVLDSEKTASFVFVMKLLDPWTGQLLQIL